MARGEIVQIVLNLYSDQGQAWETSQNYKEGKDILGTEERTHAPIRTSSRTLPRLQSRFEAWRKVKASKDVSP